jgi:hypothetical protein
MTTPDLILTPKDPAFAAAGKGYLEWKTTSLSGQSWFKQWQTAVQFMAAAAALKQQTGEEIAFYVVQGLQKGRYADGWLHSPFVWAWRNQLGEVTEWSWEVQRKKGWERVPVWEYERGGSREWVQDMPLEELEQQFPCTPPLMVDEEMLATFIRQCEKREAEIASFRCSGDELQADIFEGTFPQHFTACCPPIGYGCSYVECCHQPVVGRDPLASGKFKVREPHHAMEREWLKAKGERNGH